MASRSISGILWTLVSVNTTTLVIGGLTTWLGYVIPIRLKQFGLLPELVIIAGLASLVVACLGLCALNYSSYYALNIYGFCCSIFVILLLVGLPEAWHKSDHSSSLPSVSSSPSRSPQHSQTHQLANDAGVFREIIYFVLLFILVIVVVFAFTFAHYLRHKDSLTFGSLEQGDICRNKSPVCTCNQRQSSAYANLTNWLRILCFRFNYGGVSVGNVANNSTTASATNTLEMNLLECLKSGAHRPLPAVLEQTAGCRCSDDNNRYYWSKLAPCQQLSALALGATSKLNQSAPLIHKGYYFNDDDNQIANQLSRAKSWSRDLGECEFADDSHLTNRRSTSSQCITAASLASSQDDNMNVKFTDRVNPYLRYYRQHPYLYQQQYQYQRQHNHNHRHHCHRRRHQSQARHQVQTADVGIEQAKQFGRSLDGRNLLSKPSQYQSEQIMSKCRCQQLGPNASPFVSDQANGLSGTQSVRYTLSRLTRMSPGDNNNNNNNNNHDNDANNISRSKRRAKCSSSVVAMTAAAAAALLGGVTDIGSLTGAENNPFASTGADEANAMESGGDFDQADAAEVTAQSYEPYDDQQLDANMPRAPAIDAHSRLALRRPVMNFAPLLDKRN